jgi:hydroxypyruvate reductase/glycerate 2-kinase
MSLKQSAVNIFESALSAVKPKNSIPKRVRLVGNSLHVNQDTYDLKPYKRVFVFGSGKAGYSMALELEKILGTRLSGGLVVSPKAHKNTNITFLQSTHPIPSKASLKAGDELLKEFSLLQNDDFYIYLLSGGSSALIESLKSGITLEKLQFITANLLKTSLPIQEINTKRKELSNIKGGGLANATTAKGIVLVLSDVIGDDLQSIGSAPLMSENPPPHHFIGTNKLALLSAKNRALELGFEVEIVTDALEGDVEDTTAYICEKLKKLKANSCLLFGGESTVHVKGSGKGGRNQHMVLLALKKLASLKEFAFLSAGTDGIDGNSDAAGAVVDEFTCKDNIDAYLENNDSNSYFKQTKSLIVTGATKTNVMDIMIVLKG